MKQRSECLSSILVARRLNFASSVSIESRNLSGIRAHIKNKMTDDRWLDGLLQYFQFYRQSHSATLTLLELAV